MNHIYRLCWNRSSGQWVPASELASRAAPFLALRKRAVGHRALMLSVFTASLCAAGMAYAGTGAVGGQITSGSGQIQQVGNTTTIRQDSSTLTLNWQSFNIAPNQSVDFLQPSAISATSSPNEFSCGVPLKSISPSTTPRNTAAGSKTSCAKQKIRPASRIGFSLSGFN